MMTVVYDRSNSLPSAAWCQIPHLTQMPYSPGKGAGVSNARGMPGFFFRGGGGGMLMLQIDQYITKYLALNNKGILSLKLSNICVAEGILVNI